MASGARQDVMVPLPQAGPRHGAHGAVAPPRGPRPRGLEVTFVCTEPIRNLLIDALAAGGFPKRHGKFELAPGMPPLCPTQMAWNIDGAPEGRQAAFDLALGGATPLLGVAQVTGLAEIVMCNTFLEAETGAFELHPEILPIGPLFADQELRKPVG
ncbi:hypothetical protein ZWY2020_017575 [Hordeum vulgare]|nr:hypothetical protein ZWY2020_017575 [Hordeum vulgare]